MKLEHVYELANPWIGLQRTTENRGAKAKERNTRRRVKRLWKSRTGIPLHFQFLDGEVTGYILDRLGAYTEPYIKDEKRRPDRAVPLTKD